MSVEPDKIEAGVENEGEFLGGVLGSQRTEAVDHLAHKRNPDRELRLNGEPDTLYDDGLDIDVDAEPAAGTDGEDPKGIKG
jgi:hypothetical protein